MSKVPSRPVSWTRPYADPPLTDVDPGTRTWITRGANFVIVVTEAEAGAVLSRADEVDEYMVLTSGPAVTVEAGGQVLEAPPQSVTIVPPGASTVRMQAAGQVVRFFTSKATDLAERAANADAYASGVDDVAPLDLWPMPVGGYALRNYLLAEHTRDDNNMRIFNTRGLMLNVTKVRNEPRDTGTLTPHHHDDFEQGSLCLTGTYLHHLRYPWTPNYAEWREDEHIELESPSVLVITPRTIHTSRNLAGEPGWLIDLFAPPRVDFAKRGIVANASEYPMKSEGEQRELAGQQAG
jgi:mannose-6-phosphate isomerase-like protein (cupin superfamily)